MILSERFSMFVLSFLQEASLPVFSHRANGRGDHQEKGSFQGVRFADCERVASAGTTCSRSLRERRNELQHVAIGTCSQVLR
jgi:hypothetical protein